VSCADQIWTAMIVIYMGKRGRLLYSGFQTYGNILELPSSWINYEQKLVWVDWLGRAAEVTTISIGLFWAGNDWSSVCWVDM